MLLLRGAIARLVVSAAGRAERESFSDFAGPRARDFNAWESFEAQNVPKLAGTRLPCQLAPNFSTRRSAR